MVTLLLAAGLWSAMLDPPAEYASFQRSVEKIGAYACADFDVEVYRQANGPGTFQRVMMSVPRERKGKLPCVIAPFYFPEAMLGFNPKDGSLSSENVETGTNLAFYAGISYMSDLARQGYVTVSADAYHLTYRPQADASWRRAGEALNADWPRWSGVGKLAFDTRLLVDLASADPRVDASRIGMIGHSLGGKMAFVAGMIDSRVRVVVASDFGLGWTQTNWGDCWYWGEKLAILRGKGLSNVDLLSQSGGKPFCLIAGETDDADSGRLMRSADGYEGHPERLRFIRHGTGHRPPTEATQEGYRFLALYLRPETIPIPSGNVEEILARYDSATNVPGVVSVVIGRDGKERVCCSGFADIENRRRMEPDTLFWVASNTKAISAALMLTLVEEGRVSLDDTVERYLPEFSRLTVEDPAAVGGSRPAKAMPTIRQLLSHTSGLKFCPAMPIDRWPVRLVASKAASVPQLADPGTRYRYSNWGIDVAMAVVEVVTGEPWERMLQERILDPLEMSDTTFHPNASQLARLAVSYRMSDETPPAAMRIDQLQFPYSSPGRYASGGGGLFSTATDMARFFRMLANRGIAAGGRRVLSERMVDELLKKQTPACVDVQYSLGLKLEGSSRIGHGGAYHTYGQADLEDRTVRVFMTQACGESVETKRRFAAWQDATAKDGGVVSTEGQGPVRLDR